MADAVRALDHYLAFRPSDQNAIFELASQYLSLAQAAYQGSGLSAHKKMIAAERHAETALQRLVVLDPNSSSDELMLGQTAMVVGDKPTAVRAFTQFINLAPNDVEAPTVRKTLQQLTQ